MKNILSLFAAVLITLGALAQTEEKAPSDTTKVKFGGVDVMVVNKEGNKKDSTITDYDYDDDTPDKNDFTFYSGIDLGVNVLLNPSGGTSLEEGDRWLEIDNARSLSWSFNIFEQKIRLVKDYVGITTGLGITYNSYGLKNNVKVQSTSDSTFAITIPDTLWTFDKNKLRTTYIRVPLLLEFNTSNNPDRTFHLAAGVVGGVRIGSITKQEYRLDDQKIKERVKDDFNFTPFTADAMVRVGYSNFTLWASYGLTPLFENNKGPEVHNLSFGLTLLPFD